MTADRLGAVIAAVEQNDPDLASQMHVAADGLSAGEGEERLRREDGKQVEPAVTALTSAGRAAALTFLRARGIAPGRRSDLGLG